jgi:uncharacterized membrane protein YidH (DUF202 family)
MAAYLIDKIEANRFISLALNAAGAGILISYFWNKHIGRHAKYTPKPIWKPLVISLIIMIPFVLAAILTQE